METLMIVVLGAGTLVCFWLIRKSIDFFENI